MNPALDGISHINIYSKSKTNFGKFLSNFYHCEIKMSDGVFQSVEGYWYYLGLPECEERQELKLLYGLEAKKYGEFIKQKHKKVFDENFEKKILQAIFQKCVKNKNIIIENKEYCNLPFEHYYNMGNKIINVKNKYLFFVNGISEICKLIWLIY